MICCPTHTHTETEGGAGGVTLTLPLAACSNLCHQLSRPGLVESPQPLRCSGFRSPMCSGGYSSWAVQGTGQRTCQFMPAITGADVEFDCACTTFRFLDCWVFESVASNEISIQTFKCTFKAQVSAKLDQQPAFHSILRTFDVSWQHKERCLLFTWLHTRSILTTSRCTKPSTREPYESKFIWQRAQKFSITKRWLGSRAVQSAFFFQPNSRGFVTEVQVSAWARVQWEPALHSR